MNYEIVELEEKNVVGVSARTNNCSPDMSQIIGGLWETFFKDIYASIPEKTNEKALGIYTDYDGDEKSDYSIIVACEVNFSLSDKSLPPKTVRRSIPAGKYAKFVVIGDMRQAVAEFWKELWKMDLPRSFAYDFEEYQNESMDQAEIHIYISLK